MSASVLQPPNLSIVKVLDTIATTRVALTLRTGGRKRISALGQKQTSLPSILAEHPSAITDDLVARASGITGVAQRQASSLQVATVRFYKKASDWEVATRLSGAQTGPVTIFYGRGGRRIQAPGGLITVIVRQVGADDEQCFRATPQPRQHLRDLVRSGVTDDKRQQ